MIMTYRAADREGRSHGTTGHCPKLSRIKEGTGTGLKRIACSAIAEITRKNRKNFILVTKKAPWSVQEAKE